MCVYLKANELSSIIKATYIAKSKLYSFSYCLAYYKLNSIKKDCVYNKAYSKLAQSIKSCYSLKDVKKAISCLIKLVFNCIVCNNISNNQYFRFKGYK